MVKERIFQYIRKNIVVSAAEKYLGVFQSFQKWAIEGVRTIALALYAESKLNALNQTLEKNKLANSKDALPCGETYGLQ